jgi:hypothetical protein
MTSGSECHDFLHNEVAIIAAGNGKNVICEKPLACSIVITEFGAMSALLTEEQVCWFKFLVNKIVDITPYIPIVEQLMQHGR